MGQEIYIVRHGESEGNAGLPSQNHREIPLTDLVERPLDTANDRMERFNRLPRLGNCEGRLLQYDASSLQNTSKERYTVKDILDLTECRELTNTFGGSGRKKKLIYNDRTYMYGEVRCQWRQPFFRRHRLQNL